MTNDPALGQPDLINNTQGRLLNRISRWLPLSWADDTSYGKINNAEWLEREAARLTKAGLVCWIHHDVTTDTGALFSNRFYTVHNND